MQVIMRIIYIISISAILAIMSGCGGTAQPNTNTANNANVPKTNTNDVLAVKTPTPEATTNNAPTLTPVYKAYCDARVKNDEAALRRIYSSDAIKFFQEEMKRQKVKTLVEYLQDEPMSGKLCEVRNEQITGDTAIAEIRADSYPNGIKIIFVKENGEWKLTNRSPVTDKGKSPSSSPNPAK